MLVLMVAIFFGIRSNKIMYEGPTTFGQDFRTGARTASFFALLVGAITFTYYSKIDADFFPTKIAATVAEYEQNIPEMIKEKGYKEAHTLFVDKVVNLNVIYSPIEKITGDID